MTLHHTSTKGHAAHRDVCWHCVGIGARRAAYPGIRHAVVMFARVEQVVVFSWFLMFGALLLMTWVAWTEHVAHAEARQRAVDNGVALMRCGTGSVPAVGTTDDLRVFTTPAVITIKDLTTGPATLQGAHLTGPDLVEMDDLVVRVTPQGNLHLVRRGPEQAGTTLFMDNTPGSWMAADGGMQ